NGNSFKPVPRTTANADGTFTLTIPGPVTTEEKAQKNNDVKARSMLLMALPNKHLLTFSKYNDAKTLFEATQTRFGVNDATKKTQRTLLKQMYKNFNAPSTESLDSIFNRLQKLSPKNQESRPRNQDSSRNTVNVKDTSSKAMVAIDGEGFDWSYMADDEVPTNMALMVFLDLEVLNSKTCSNTFLKSFETLKTQYDNLRIEFNKCEFDLATYKRGLFAPPSIDLSNFGLKEFQHHEFKGYEPKDSKSVCVDTANDIKKDSDAPIIKDWVSDSDEDESKEMVLKTNNVQHKPE
nr:hypothetical protein [Tanacetum cinerariifolium]